MSAEADMQVAPDPLELAPTGMRVAMRRTASKVWLMRDGLRGM